MNELRYRENSSPSFSQYSQSRDYWFYTRVPACVFDYYPALTRLKKYVEKNLSESITLQQAANVACYEKKYFSYYFRSKTGMKFSDWLAGIRIERAKLHLCQTDKSITCVALDSGFNNLRSFQRAFKKHVGLSPQSYKNKFLHEICRGSHTN